MGERLLKGDTLALARAISWAEDRDPRIQDVLRRVYPRTGTAYRVGITGPPGAGKSTLIAGLVAEFKRRGGRVAVVAVDPTSPFTGGALLGDRFRMHALAEDTEVFVRSMATRGSTGGLARATDNALDLIDAAGYTWILVETVGVGQVEMDILEAADTVVVVLVPESGDGIQTMKAGLMEIGDLFVVNKADREGADRLAREIESGLDLRARNGDRPEVLLTRAVGGDGVPELASAVERHRARLEGSGALRARRRRTHKFRLLAEARRAVMDRLLDEEGPELEGILDRIEKRELTPRDAAEHMIKRLGA
jgi:LAO/AO transport system kinase